jgi:N6-L-threonylcarbamoyladenine synthase
MSELTILGIETSCDETSAAIVRGDNVLANIVSSQTVHEQFGGVVPELASRAHIRLVSGIVEKALNGANINPEELSGIAVTYGPGLVGALLVGLNFAKGMARSLEIPFIGINHIEGHIYGNFLTHPGIEFPHLSIVVSGGHTQLVVMKKHLDYKVVGKTRDDAVGEAFDKGAKMLGLGYPGGPLIDKLAREGDIKFHKFPRAVLKGDTFDFSYSGLKTALLVYIENNGMDFINSNINDVCASYQEAAVDIIVKKAMRAAHRYKVKSIGLVGGVAANSRLRILLQQAAEEDGIAVRLPEFKFCTDNAAMIARAGLERLRAGTFSPYSLNAFPALKLGEERI